MTCFTYLGPPLGRREMFEISKACISMGNLGKPRNITFGAFTPLLGARNQGLVPIIWGHVVEENPKLPRTCFFPALAGAKKNNKRWASWVKPLCFPWVYLGFWANKTSKRDEIISTGFLGLLGVHFLAKIKAFKTCSTILWGSRDLTVELVFDVTF